MTLNQLDHYLVTRMEELAGECDEALYETGATTLMCSPPVTYDAYARYELNARRADGATHDETVFVLLTMVTEGYAGIFRDGHGFYFEGHFRNIPDAFKTMHPASTNK